jgi:hypothetical protein
MKVGAFILMENPMTDLAVVEQELTELTSQLKQSFQVLDGLAQIQRQFEELAQTHQRYQEYLDSSHATQTDITQLQKTIDRRLLELEINTRSKWEEMRSQTAQMQSDLSAADRTLTNDLTQQVNSLRRDFEERFSGLVQDVQRQRDFRQAPLDELENKLMAELRATVNRIKQTSVTTNQLETIDTQMRALRSAQQMTEKRLRMMQNWLVSAILLIVLLAVGLPLSLYLTQAYSDRLAAPEETETPLPSPESLP